VRIRAAVAALIAVVDTPGFMPGSKQEGAGVIRHGASLVRAFAAARVPKLTVILRKSYGGAYITMNSRDLGADLVLAWPEAELGIMSARAAVGIVNRRELRVAADPAAERLRLAEEYAREHLPAYKRVRRLEFADLPKTSTGKIQKFKLRDMAKEV